VKGVRVRFAPSPTGYLHVGGARTALFNWLFARHEGGAFILRVEDTDVERSSADLESQMLEDMRGLGLEWDEGPHAGGPHGPYRQSERTALYRGYTERLIDEGRAYSCFCTDEDLALKRKESLKAGRPPRYDGTCRVLDEEGKSALRSEGRPESIRFRVEGDEEILVEDLVRGEVVFPPDMVGDFVIRRSNNLPTYNFAAAVDDALMEITHVIRGEEHLPNTVRQIRVYRALGFDAPTFAHIPLILGPDRSKLSKRHGAPNIKDFRERGYPAGAIVNYLSFLGWSPKDQREIFTIGELVEEFTLAGVSNSPGIFDEIKLNWVSSQHIRAGGSGRYLDDALPYFPDEFREWYDRQVLGEIFDVASESLSCLSELGEAVDPFRKGKREIEAEARPFLDGAGCLLSAIAEELASVEDWNVAEIKSVIKGVGSKLGVKGKALFMPLRAALTGAMHGPDLATVIKIRGRDDVLRTLRAAG
jgi:nondiscriminating glutamyl-tRNA synthetase